MSNVKKRSNLSLTTQEKLEDFYLYRLRQGQGQKGYELRPVVLQERAKKLAREEMETYDDLYFENLAMKNFYQETAWRG